MATIKVSLGPATVEIGDQAADGFVIDKTKGGVQFQANTSKQDVTIDQYGDTPVKSILKGRTCQVTIPMVENDLKKLSSVTPNSKLTTDATDQTKQRLDVYAQSGFDLLSVAQKVVIKPTDPAATANDWITIPVGSPLADVEYTYDSENVRVANVTIAGYPDDAGLLYTMGDTSVVVPA